MSAPSRSASPAISFMKLILVASMQLAAYLVSSAERTSITMILSWLRLNGRIDLAQHLLGLRVRGADDDAVGAHAVGDRGALLEEFRVGDHVEMQIALPRSASASASLARTLSAVPTGTVDLVTTILGSAMCPAMVAATASTYFRSAEPSSSGGVPTAMIWMRPCATPSAASVVNCSRPSAWFFFTRSSSPGS